MEVKIDSYKSRQISIFFFDRQDLKPAMEVKIDSYKSIQVSIFLFHVQNPKIAMEVSIDSYKSRQISILSFDVQDPKSTMEVKIGSQMSRYIRILLSVLQAQEFLLRGQGGPRPPLGRDIKFRRKWFQKTQTLMFLLLYFLMRPPFQSHYGSTQNKQ